MSINTYHANQILERAYNSVQAEYSIEDAVAWAEGFKMPPEVHTSDLQELISLDYNLTELIRRKQSRNSYTRMSVDRLMALWDTEDPDFDFLCEFARDGVHVMTGTDFAPRREKSNSFSP